MTTHDANSMAAAELADRYIEIVLSTKPEQLVPSITTADFNTIAANAKRLADFRLTLIQQLSQQPLQTFQDD